MEGQDLEGKLPYQLLLVHLTNAQGRPQSRRILDEQDKITIKASAEDHAA